MVALLTDQPPAHTGTGLAVDHVGMVVRDLGREIAAWRALGFRVSDPVPLMGTDARGRAVPLGQSSAHVVFENSYVELSSPEPGSGNHLERYLAAGEGVRILVLAAADAAAAHAAVAASHPGCPAPRPASRAIVIAGKEDIARFVWFPLPFDVVPGVLSAVVAHATPELVFHPSLVDHPNGARRVTRFFVRGASASLAVPALPATAGRDLPDLARCDLPGASAICGFALTVVAGSPERHVSLDFPSS